MKKAGTIFTIVCLALTTNVRGQYLEIEAGAGIAATRMDDMKYLQEYLLENYPLPGKVLNSFPPFTTFSFKIGKEVVPSVRLAAAYSYTSTGGRSDYTDYSGSISTDMLATSHRIGGLLFYEVVGGESYDLSVYGGADFNLSHMDISTSFYVMGYSDGVVYEYKSATISGSAGLSFYYHFNDVSVGLEGGYLVDKPGQMSERNSGEDLTDPEDRERILTTDWSGWRTQVKIMIRL